MRALLGSLQRASSSVIRNSSAVASAVILAAIVATQPLHAQSATRVMSPGSAAVTGFSGKAIDPSAEPINSDGPSLRIVPLPSSPNGLVDVAKTFTITARQVGQVYGVALDDQPAPDIFVAATAAYGLAIEIPGQGRIQHGATGAQYVAGLFGPPDQNGGPGSIWRVDGSTGQVTLFANVTFSGIQSAPASLGGLAYDPHTQQLFVADRATGMIHRFGMDGSDRGVFDHGVDGRTAAHLPPVPFDPATLANIASPSFDSQNPKTWGFAPAPRRIFALAMRAGRLFYAVADGPQVWSVGIMPDGSFAHDAHLEVGSPALTPGSEISQISFDDHPHLYVAERAPVNGTLDFLDVADGQERVLRFAPKNYRNPAPGYWQTPGDQYAIGMLPQYQSANGGVDIKCGSSVWATGEHLIDRANAATGSFPRIDGLQGSDASLIEPANMPPQQSRVVNYYDGQADPASHGHMGAIAIWNVCGGGGAAMPPPLPPPPMQVFGPPPGEIGFGCPPGTIELRGTCLLPPACPPESEFRDGYCVYPGCPVGNIKLRGICMPPPQVCRMREAFIGDRCVPLGCPRGLDRADNGYCRCPEGREFRNGSCQGCPRGDEYRDGRCVPVNGCPPDQRRDFSNKQCGCPRGDVSRDGRCVPVGGCQQSPDRAFSTQCACPRGEVYRDGRCVIEKGCPRGETYRDGRCVALGGRCPRGEIYQDGMCRKSGANGPGCPQGEVFRDGACRKGGGTTGGTCPRGEIYQDGLCRKSGANGPGCPQGEVYRNGRCVANEICPIGETYRDGACRGSGTNNNYTRGSEGSLRGQTYGNPQRFNGTFNGSRGSQGSGASTQSCPHGEYMKDGHCVRSR